MRFEKFRLLGLALLLTAASSCAVNMKMHGNRFESSEVYGKTGFRIKTAYQGQANVELTDDFTLTAPNTAKPAIGPTHELVIGAGFGIKERIELSADSSWGATAKFQLLGAPKIRADEGNFSLAVLGSIGANQNDQSGSGWFSNQHYKVHLEYTTFGGALLAGYRADKIVNFYAGPFIETGSYKGTYETVGVTTSAFDGKGLNKGAVIGMEIGTPRVTGMIEGAWNHTTSASAKNSYWVGGAQIVISFGSVKPASEESGSERPRNSSAF